ncbi:MAG: NAD-dependent epimerase/dehydratase family protein [Acidobacteriota bacterium]
MRVLIIGGSRFIGLAVAQRLLIDGHRITLLNRGKTADPFGTRVSRVLGDRSDPTTLQRAVARRDFDVAIDVIAFREEDTRAAIEKLDGRIGHFIHVSTASVYLIRDGLFSPFREDDFPGRLTPKNESTASSWLYAYHKRRCEQALMQAWEARQFPGTSLRLPMVVGPGDYTERSLAYLERIADGGPLILPDGGLNSWGFLWVEDIAEVIAANLMNAVTFGRAYNLAQREVVSVRQFVDAAAAAMARTPAVACVPSEWLQRMHVGTAFSPYSHDRDIVLDTQAARSDLLFEPTPFEQWSGRLVAHFRSSWDHTPSKHYATRPLELRIVQELAQLRVPAIAPVSLSR